MLNPNKPKTPSSTRSLRSSLVALLLIGSLGLTGCATQTGLLSPDDLYPAEFTTCAAEPKVPERPAPGVPRTDEAKAEYTKDLRGAWADCSDDVAGIKDRKARYQVQYDNAQGGFLTKLFPKKLKEDKK